MGYTGPIYGTPATLDMTGLILRDSARLQVADNERKNRKRLRAGEPPQEPLYTPDDAEKILSQLRPVPYQKEFEVAPGIKAIWNDSGHMLGSASIQLIVEEDGKTKRVVFSGDLGPRSAPILREFEPFQQADLVFLESTYGGRDHRSFAETVAEFERIVIDAVNRGGKMLVPTFAVGRAQLITLLLGENVSRRKSKAVSDLPRQPDGCRSNEHLRQAHGAFRRRDESIHSRSPAARRSEDDETDADRRRIARNQ